MNRKIALITGATAGIGEACAILLASKDFDIILTGRREDRLKKISEKIKAETESDACYLCFDITDRESVEQAIDSLNEKWRNIDILINNAGLASGLNNFDEGEIEDWEVMIDTNIKGLLYISRKIAPQMKERKSGHIINIGSIAGKEVYPKGNIYCATKHAVDALTKGMRIDLLEHNIKVTQIAPGMVETEFSLVRFKGDKERAAGVYEKIDPLYANDIAEAVLFAATRPTHVNINDMLIMPTSQASATNIIRKE
jgi:3-hydroxy acid dehydrogenase / malonic semialdehyde reductase